MCKEYWNQETIFKSNKILKVWDTGFSYIWWVYTLPVERDDMKLEKCRHESLKILFILKLNIG